MRQTEDLYREYIELVEDMKSVLASYNKSWQNFLDNLFIIDNTINIKFIFLYNKVILIKNDTELEIKYKNPVEVEFCKLFSKYSLDILEEFINKYILTFEVEYEISIFILRVYLEKTNYSKNSFLFFINILSFFLQRNQIEMLEGLLREENWDELKTISAKISDSPYLSQYYNNLVSQHGDTYYFFRQSDGILVSSKKICSID